MSISVSVVMAAHNAAATVEEAIESVRGQALTEPFELVVVDDKSSDETLRIVENLASPLIKVISLPSRVGRAEARNIAVNASSGRIIVIADADDIAFPGRLQMHLDAFNAEKRLTVHGAQLLDVVDGVQLNSSELSFPVSSRAIDRQFALGRMGIAHPASAFTRKWFDQQGGYDPGLAWCEDYDLYARGWEPNTFSSEAAAVIGYRRRTKVTSWDYWWENQRHLAAINARLRVQRDSPGIGPAAIDQYLRHSSTKWARFLEKIRFLRYRVLLRVRTCP